MKYLPEENVDIEPIHFDKCFKTKEIKSYKSIKSIYPQAILEEYIFKVKPDPMKS